MGQKRAEETRIAELERKIGQQVLEIDFLTRALQPIWFWGKNARHASRPRVAVEFRNASFGESLMANDDATAAAITLPYSEQHKS